MENGEQDLFADIEIGEALVDIELKDGESTVTDKKNEDKKQSSSEQDKELENLIDTNELEKTLDSDTQESDDNLDADNTAINSSFSSSLSTVVTALGEELGIEVKQEELDKAENKGQFLRDLINNFVEEKVKTNLTDEEKEALEAIRTGVPIKEYVNTKVNTKAYASLKEEDIKENELLQEAIVKNSLITRGFTEDKANKMIGDFKALGGTKLLDEAVEAKAFMVEKEKEHEITLKEQTKKQKEAAEEKRIASLEKVKSFVSTQKEVIPNFELTESFKNEIYKSMTTSVAKDANGVPLNEVGVTRSKNPIDFEFKLNLYHKLGLFNEKPDWSKIMKVAETKQAKGLENLLKEGSSFMGNGKTKKESSKSDNLGLGIFD